MTIKRLAISLYDDWYDPDASAENDEPVAGIEIDSDTPELGKIWFFHNGVQRTQVAVYKRQYPESPFYCDDWNAITQEAITQEIEDTKYFLMCFIVEAVWDEEIKIISQIFPNSTEDIENFSVDGIHHFACTWKHDEFTTWVDAATWSYKDVRLSMMNRTQAKLQWFWFNESPKTMELTTVIDKHQPYLFQVQCLAHWIREANKQKMSHYSFGSEVASKENKTFKELDWLVGDGGRWVPIIMTEDKEFI